MNHVKYVSKNFLNSYPIYNRWISFFLSGGGIVWSTQNGNYHHYPSTSGLTSRTLASRPFTFGLTSGPLTSGTLVSRETSTRSSTFGSSPPGLSTSTKFHYS